MSAGIVSAGKGNQWYEVVFWWERTVVVGHFTLTRPSGNVPNWLVVVVVQKPLVVPCDKGFPRGADN